MNYNEFSGMMDRYNLDRMNAYEKKKKAREEQQKIKSKDNIKERKKRLSNPIINQRTNIRGFYVNDPNYPTDLFS